MNSTAAVSSQSPSGPVRGLRKRVLGAEDRVRWNRFVAASPSFGGLQSFEWGEFKEQLGWQAVRIAVESDGRLLAGAQVLVKQLALGFASIAYLPRGPIVDWQDTTLATALLETIHESLRKFRCIFLRIEPPLPDSSQAHLLLGDHGFRPTGQTNQPRCTLVMDLEPDLETLFARLPKQTRHNIRFAARCGVTVRPGEERDLPAFYDLMLETGRRAGFRPRTREYYERQFAALARGGYGALLVAEHEGRPLGIEMPFRFGSHGVALHEVSNSASRRMRASDLLTWEGLKWVKNQGCRTYDLWGIPDEVGQLLKDGKPIPENMQGGLWGVYYFKKRFGGSVHYYVGAYDYVYAKAAYAGVSALLPWLESARWIAHRVEGRYPMGTQV